MSTNKKYHWLRADQTFENVIGTQNEDEATVFTIKGEEFIMILLLFSHKSVSSTFSKNSLLKVTQKE